MTATSKANSTNITRSKRILSLCKESKRNMPLDKYYYFDQYRIQMLTLPVESRGNLATKSLTPIVNPSLLVQDSEYLETHLVAVPANLKKDYLKSYETIAPMVVPRSSIQVAQDEEFILFAVTTFKKHGAEFQQKCREARWTPRQYKYVEGGKEEEQKEIERVTREEKKVWGEALRLTRTAWSESVMIWAHVMALRVFVESVLRYGLPPDFVSALISVSTTDKYVSTKTVFHVCTNSIATDKLQVGEKGQANARLVLLVPRRKRIWTGQTGQNHKR